MSHTLSPAATAATASAPWHWIVATAVGAAALGAGGAALYLNHTPGAPTTAAVAMAPATPVSTPANVAQAAVPAPVQTAPSASHSKPNKAPARVHTAQAATKTIVNSSVAEVAVPPPSRPAPSAPAWEPPSARAVCASCGTVESVTPVAQEGKPSGMGAVAGAVLGGLLGNQIGGGDGKTLATIGGVVGGAYAGNTVEKRMHQQTSYRVLVRMDDGSARSVEQSTPSFGVGARVSVQGNVLSPANSSPAQGT